MAGKYTPLEHYLRDLPANQKEITMSFEQVERMLCDKLPPSAYRYQAWWANESSGNHVHAHAWMNASWKVDGVNFSKKWVRLVRS